MPIDRLSILHSTFLVGLCLSTLGTNAQAFEKIADSAETYDSECTSSDRETLHLYDEIEVEEQTDDLAGVASSASEGLASHHDLRRRLVFRSGELVETTPGLISTQHSGGGKANQYFLRGFTLDHGTDFAIWAAGVPVNMPSHGHGQGYSDLNFLIPEVIDRVRYYKGPYFSSRGDFSTVGGVDIEIFDVLPKRHISMTLGGYGFGRIFASDGFEAWGGDVSAGVEVSHADGPWSREEDFQKINAIVRYSRGDAERGFSLTLMGYDGKWLSTDQVPRRAVESGLIGRFDLIDSGPRGASRRYSLSAEFHRGRSRSLTRFAGYVLAYDFDLISNFTYFLEDTDVGDQFQQVDERWVYGFNTSHQWLGSYGGRRIESTVGIGFRADSITNGLFRTQETIRIGTTREDRIGQLSVGPYIETEIRWNDFARMRVGLRGEYQYADVESDLEINSGTVTDSLISPKLSLILGPWNRTEVYLNIGYGFHSNDARGATLKVDPRTLRPRDPAQFLARTVGGDIGFRTSVLSGLQSTLSLFAMELESELIFVGDSGTTAASRPSLRVGVEFTNHYRILPWLELDLDASLARSRFTDADQAGDRIPGAIERVLSAGISITDRGGFFGALRLRYFGSAALVEDNSVRSSSSAMLSGRLGFRFTNGMKLALEGFNLLNREQSDVEYFYASRLPGEPEGGIEDIHFHPAEPLTVRLVASWEW